MLPRRGDRDPAAFNGPLGEAARRERKAVIGFEERIRNGRHHRQRQQPALDRVAQQAQGPADLDAGSAPRLGPSLVVDDRDMAVNLGEGQDPAFTGVAAVVADEALRVAAVGE